MRARLRTALAMGLLASTSEAVDCDEAGGKTTYSEEFQTRKFGSVRRIVANGCPNHYAKRVSPNPNVAVEQGFDLKIPASPVLRAKYGYHEASSDVSCVGGAIAIALNGVAIFNGLVDSDCNFLDVEDNQARCGGAFCVMMIAARTQPQPRRHRGGVCGRPSGSPSTAAAGTDWLRSSR